ncbi:MAG: class I tRNA ligase family protein, partial [Nanoarchaeota archaeon]|nr:class I tRNA ligase family protein [Nanoarchaeota archaeon]
AGVDSARYFLFRGAPFGEDGDFSEQALIDRHNNELADKLGNLVSRVSALIEKYGFEKFDWEKSENEVLINRNIAFTNMNFFTIKFKNLYFISIALQKSVEKHFDNYELDKVLNEIFAFIDICNEYVQNKRPWETGDKKVLYELVESIKIIAKLLSPFIPESAEKIIKQFNSKRITKGDVLFKKIK